MNHICGHHHTHPNKNCAAEALGGLDYCAEHLKAQTIYCVVRHCTREQRDDNSLLCTGHHAEWEACGLTFEAWSEARYNAAATALQSARKVHGGK